MVVLLHGRGDSPRGWADFKRLLGSDLNFLLIQAPDPWGPGYSWYDQPPNHGPGILRSRELLTQAFAEIEAHGFAPDKTVLMGFSQGCLMTIEFGARYSKRLAGYLGISGYCYDPQALIREANREVFHSPWLITHGTQDAVLPVERTRGQIAQLKAADLAIEYREYEKAHDLNLFAELSDLKAWFYDLTHLRQKK